MEKEPEKQTPASAITHLFQRQNQVITVYADIKPRTCLYSICHSGNGCDAGGWCRFDLPPSFYTLRRSNSCRMMPHSHTAVRATTSSQLSCLFTQLPPAPNNTFPRWSYSSSVINNKLRLLKTHMPHMLAECLSHVSLCMKVWEQATADITSKCMYWGWCFWENVSLFLFLKNRKWQVWPLVLFTCSWAEPLFFYLHWSIYCKPCVLYAWSQMTNCKCSLYHKVGWASL